MFLSHQLPYNSPEKAQVLRVQVKSRCSRTGSFKEVLCLPGVSQRRQDHSNSISFLISPGHTASSLFLTYIAACLLLASKPHGKNPLLPPPSLLHPTWPRGVHKREQERESLMAATLSLLHGPSAPFRTAWPRARLLPKPYGQEPGIAATLEFKSGPRASSITPFPTPPTMSYACLFSIPSAFLQLPRLAWAGVTL